MVDFLELYTPLCTNCTLCTNWSLLGRTEVDTAKHSTPDMTDSFLTIKYSKSHSARKLGRNSLPQSMVFTLHGLPFMQFPNFRAHAQHPRHLVFTWFSSSHQTLGISAVVCSWHVQFERVNLTTWRHWWHLMNIPSLTSCMMRGRALAVSEG